MLNIQSKTTLFDFWSELAWLDFQLGATWLDFQFRTIPLDCYRYVSIFDSGSLNLAFSFD